ncbi:putative DNA-binding domain-containing protein [Myxococcaceae bacterium GXIMD 01537]
MKLDDFFATVGPFLRGRATHAQTARTLYGTPEGRAAVDAKRLAVYGRFARLHRFEVVDSIYPHLRRAVLARGGTEAWEAMAEEYFQRHPMLHFELNANGIHLPEFLEGYAKRKHLPAWMPQLADFEWWEWLTLIAPSEPAEGPTPRIAACVEARPYAYDFVGWLETPASERAPEPEAQESLVVFWRDAGFRLRRENTAPEELLVMQAVLQGLDLEAVAASSQVPLESLQETFEDLASAGILVTDSTPPGT